MLLARRATNHNQLHVETGHFQMRGAENLLMTLQHIESAVCDRPQAEKDLAAAVADIEATLMELKRERLLAELAAGDSSADGAERPLLAGTGPYAPAEAPRGIAARADAPAAASVAHSTVRIGGFSSRQERNLRIVMLCPCYL